MTEDDLPALPELPAALRAQVDRLVAAEERRRPANDTGAARALLHLLCANRRELADLHIIGAHPWFLDWQNLEFRVLHELKDCAAKYGWPDSVVGQLAADLLPILKQCIRNTRERVSDA
jgi:hypothetical protein